MNVINYLLTSSEDPAKISLFIKSVAALAVLFGLDSTVVSAAQNDIATIVTNGAMVISALVALYGLARKIKNGQWSASPSA